MLYAVLHTGFLCRERTAHIIDLATMNIVLVLE